MKYATKKIFIKNGLTEIEIWQKTAWRSKTVLLIFLIAFSIVIIRAFYLQFINVEQWQKRAELRYTKHKEISAPRGKILDRNGEILATSFLEFKVGVVPSRFNPSQEKLRDLSTFVEMSFKEIKKRSLISKNYFYIDKGIDKETVKKIKQLEIVGIEFEQTYRRQYPYGQTVSTLLGMTDEKDRGIEGVERAFDNKLRGIKGIKIIKVGRGNTAFDEKSLKEPLPGKNITLTIDSSLQSLAYKEAKYAQIKHKARAVSIVVLDPRSGDILAMVNTPAFDPEKRKKLSFDEVRNRSIIDNFEPGSTFKPFAIAAALEQGLVSKFSQIETSPGFIKIGDKELRDPKSFGLLSIEDILAKSSNVGTVRVALKMKPVKMYRYYELLGFGKTPDLPLLGLAKGKLSPWQGWRDIDQATISYGYGVSVTLLQLARAYSVFARDGDLISLRISKEDRFGQSINVFSSEVVSDVRAMLERASSKIGTGSKAKVSGFIVAGKTGTSKKIKKGIYSSNRYIASYVGFAPSNDPRFIVAIMVDEPQGKITGGKVAAPIFSKIATNALRRLQMSPDPKDRIFPQTVKFVEKNF